MLKFGIHKLSQLQSGRLRTIFGGRKKISISILAESKIGNLSQGDYEAILFEQVDDRGAYKRTASMRFPEFDSLTIESIKNSHDDTLSDLRIHDVGVSNACTSVEFFHAVKEHYRRCSILATDYAPYLTVLRERSLSVALTENGKIVDITFPPFVFTPHQLENLYFYPLNHIVRLTLMNFRVKHLVRKFTSGNLDPDQSFRLDLFSPSAQEAARKFEEFGLGQHDLLQPYEKNAAFHCVRAMNVLNDTYFSDIEMQTILRNIHNSLLPSGIFSAGSNQDPNSTVDGAIYMCMGSQFVRVRSSGNARRIQRHIDSFNHAEELNA